METETVAIVEEIAAPWGDLELPTTTVMIEPGGLYWIRLPVEWSPAQVQTGVAALRRVFTGDTVRLSPPAHFIVSTGAFAVEEASDEEMEGYIARYTAILQDRQAERESAGTHHP